MLKIPMRMLDLTVHPENRQQGGMRLLRSRMLSISCIFIIFVTSAFLINLLSTRSMDSRLIPNYSIISTASLCLILNRFFRESGRLTAVLIVLLSMLLYAGVVYQARSVYASAFLWFQILIGPAFLLCGWRIGFLVSTLVLLVALMALGVSMQFGSALPYDGDRGTGFRLILATIFLANLLVLGITAVYFNLLHKNEIESQTQKVKLQRAARMQELFQVSGHFVTKTSGPLDVLGTALSYLADPLQNRQPSAVLQMLESVESSVEQLAAVSRSFSLFSRPHMEEGLEQTSFNLVLQHVDTICNVGKLGQPDPLKWEVANPDIPIFTQTAKLVMVVLGFVRRASAQGGGQLQAAVNTVDHALLMTLTYQVPTENRRVAASMDRSELLNPELTEDMIQQLCDDLGIEWSQQREGDQQILYLKLQQGLIGVQQTPYGVSRSTLS